MKRCPECRRDYYDDTLLYCLDDGAALLEGPASMDEPATAILSEPASAEEQPGRVSGSSNKEHGDLPPGRSTRRPVHRAAWIAAAAVILLTGGFFAFRYLSTAATKQIDSIAVMPFVNDSDGADSDYLSDGMTEALISSLSNIPGLNVKARSSVFRYKGSDAAPGKIGTELNVQAVLNGRLAQRGDDVTLHVELIDAVTENVVWSERYSRKQHDIVELQSEIARDVSSKLARRLARQDIDKLPTENAEAYQLYLQGRFHFNKRHREALSRGMEYFEQAIVKDPRFALAYVGLADCYIVANTYDLLPPAEAYPKAKAAVQKALEVDDSLAEAYIAQAAISEDYDWDWPSAEQNYKKGIDLKPNYAQAYQWYGEFLRMQGRHDEAVAAVRKAVELDPVALPVNASLGLTLYYAGRCAEAIPQLQKTSELDPTFPVPYAYLGLCYTMMGRHDDAIPQHQASIGGGRPRRSADLALYAYSLGKAGRTADAREVVSELEIRSKSEFVDKNELAIALYGLGELDATFAALALAVEQRSPGVRYIMVEPMFGDDLRADPRYFELVRKIGL